MLVMNVDGKKTQSESGVCLNRTSREPVKEEKHGWRHRMMYIDIVGIFERCNIPKIPMFVLNDQRWKTTSI